MLNSTLRTHDLVSISVQILKAIQHLHNFGIIHKDIAARLFFLYNSFSFFNKLHNILEIV